MITLMGMFNFPHQVGSIVHRAHSHVGVTADRTGGARRVRVLTPHGLAAPCGSQTVSPRWPLGLTSVTGNSQAPVGVQRRGGHLRGGKVEAVGTYRRCGEGKLRQEVVGKEDPPEVPRG